MATPSKATAKRSPRAQAFRERNTLRRKLQAMEEDAKRADRAYERALADLRVAKEELRKRGQSLCQLREALIYAQQHHLSDSIVDAREREAGQAEQRYDEQNDIYRQANTTKTRAREELNRLRQDYNLTEKLYRAANAKHLSLRDSNDA